MAGNVYSHYVWLLDTIARHNGITFKEISEAWDISELNELGAPLSKRTFHNHIDKIYDLFRIEINCGPGYQYYINWSDNINLKNIQQSLLLNLQISNTLFSNRRLAGRISLDGFLSFRYYTPLINAIEKGAVAELLLFYEGVSKNISVKIEPYYIKQFEFDWFIVGRELQSGEINAYAFRNIIGVRLSEENENFDIPGTFSISDFIRNPELGEATPHNNNEQYMQCHTNSQSRIRRGRWGSYIPEGYKHEE